MDKTKGVKTKMYICPKCHEVFDSESAGSFCNKCDIWYCDQCLTKDGLCHNCGIIVLEGKKTKMHTAVKARIYPNCKQKELLAKHFGGAR